MAVKAALDGEYARARPCVSIGLPVFNGAQFLETAVRSILDQTYEDFELLIFDNASTDETAMIAESFARKDHRVRLYRQQSNVGAARNYNATVEHAQGRYFRWAAHDDCIEPTFLERCVRVLDSRPDAVLAYPRTIIIDSHGTHQFGYLDGRDLRQDDPVERFYLSIKSSNKECNAVFGLIRLDILRQTGCIGAYPSADRILLAELALFGKIIEVPEPLFLRRDHPETSLRANDNYRAITSWFTGRKSILPQFRYGRWLWEYVRAVWRSPLTLYDRQRAMGVLLRWAAGRMAQKFVRTFSGDGVEVRSG